MVAGGRTKNSLPSTVMEKATGKKQISWDGIGGDIEILVLDMLNLYLKFSHRYRRDEYHAVESDSVNFQFIHSITYSKIVTTKCPLCIIHCSRHLWYSLNKTDKYSCPQGAYILVEEDRNKLSIIDE